MRRARTDRTVLGRPWQGGGFLLRALEFAGDDLRADLRMFPGIVVIRGVDAAAGVKMNSGLAGELQIPFKFVALIARRAAGVLHVAERRICNHTLLGWR